MKLFLNGGGSGEKVLLAYQKFNELVDHTKPLLYIPLAMTKHRYPDCLEWIKTELKDINISNIEMITSADEILTKKLNDYCAIFIGGGNTFKLLSELKESGAFDKIREYIDNDGIIYGGSAGAIIFGYDINSCLYADENVVDTKDTKGFNYLNGKSLTTHYTNKSEEEKATDYLIEYTKTNEDVYAISEETTIYIEDNNINFIGEQNVYCFSKGNKKLLKS